MTYSMRALVTVALVFGGLTPARAQLSDFIPGMRKNDQAAVLLELEQLGYGVRAHREKQLAPAYPPCLSDADPAARKARFMRHVASVWPRAKYGETENDYDALKQKIAEVWKYNFVDDGKVAALDLDRLDPSEALCFWLNGFPTPVDPTNKKPISAGKDFTFHRDPTDPFKRDAADSTVDDPLRDRVHRMFDFDQARLVDRDHDGWWEYLPPMPKDDAERAPYAYFDATTYVETNKRRELRGSCFFPRDARFAKSWGVATPYLESFDPAKPEASVWAEPDRFQIVSGGLDGKYGARGDGMNSPAPRLTALHPLKTFLASDNFAEAKDVDPAQRDNLTSLGSQPIAELK